MSALFGHMFWEESLPLLPRLCISLAGLFMLAASLSAADLPVRVTSAQIGLPPAGRLSDQAETGQSTHVAKFAAWAPLYLELELTVPIGEPAEVVVETADPDEINTSLAIPLDLAGVATGSKVAAADLGSIAYVRPAGAGEVTITVRQAGGGKPLSEPFRVRIVRPRDPLTYVMLTLGPAIPGFELPKPTTGSTDATVGNRGGRVEAAEISSINQLPDRWFGYASADVVLLNTSPGAEPFLNALFSDEASPKEKIKREALIEWLRRGGRLVVSVGGNAGLVAKLPALQELLPYWVNSTQPSRSPGTLVLSWNAREASVTSTLSGALKLKSGSFPVANLVPRADRHARPLIPTRERLKDLKEVLAAQSAFGLGRVTVLALDLDRPPFTEFSQRPEFWDWVLREGGANRASAGSEGKPKPVSTSLTEEEDETTVALRSHTDTFEGIPVVSFGWIALLIVLYILLIGPIEYYLLKRVVGRVELTWITFPVIVLSVSLAAYFSANSLKGRELRINKLDVIDIDPASGRVFGTTWFTIFSPRIETYTLGITPGEGWSSDHDPAGTTVDWVGGPRGGRASLLRRSYDYHAGEDGLENVPIQVWSTKSFSANWSGPIGKANSPKDQQSQATTLIDSRLVHPPGDPASVIGTFVNRLPVPVLTDCVAFYAGQAYPLPGGSIHSGETVRLIFDKSIPATQWLQKESRLEEVLRRVPSYVERPGAARATSSNQARSSADGAFPMWGVLFHESALTYGEGVIPRNASLRWLDQSWRLDPASRDEVILVGRVPPQFGPAEVTLSGASAPSRLWIKGLPGPGEKRSPIPGAGRQETWVRVFLPVK